MLELFKRKRPGPEPPLWQREGFAVEHFYTAPLQQITVTVRQVPPGELHRYCGGRGNACYDAQRRIITIPRILHDHDSATFEALGHELWHALGGQHHG